MVEGVTPLKIILDYFIDKMLQFQHNRVMKLNAEQLKNAQILGNTLSDEQKQLLLNVMKDCIELGAKDEVLTPLFAAVYISGLY